MLAIRGEHPMEARGVQSWARDQGGETGNEVERFENHVGRAVAERLLERIDDPPSLVGREALIGDGRAGDVTTEFFELVTLVGLAAGGRVQGEARLFGEQGCSDGLRPRRDGAQGHGLAARIGADGNAVVDGRTAELIEHLAGLHIEVVAVGVAHEEAAAFRQPGHALGDAFQQPGEFGGSRPWRAVEHRARSIE